MYIACDNNDTPPVSSEPNYKEWDLIESSLLDMEFDFCYPSDSLESTFSFSEYEGKVLIIEMSASW